MQAKKKAGASKSVTHRSGEGRPHTVTVIEVVEVKGKVRRNEKLTPHEDVLKEIGL